MGWSLGRAGRARLPARPMAMPSLAGLVLVDNSVGEDPAPVALARRRLPAPQAASRAGPGLAREESMRSLRARECSRPQPSPAYLDRLTEATLRTPSWAASRAAGLSGPPDLLARGGLFHQQAGAVPGPAHARGASREPRIAPPGRGQRGDARRRPRDVHRRPGALRRDRRQASSGGASGPDPTRGGAPARGGPARAARAGGAVPGLGRHASASKSR